MKGQEGGEERRERREYGAVQREGGGRRYIHFFFGLGVGAIESPKNHELEATVGQLSTWLHGVL